MADPADDDLPTTAPAQPGPAATPAERAAAGFIGAIAAATGALAVFRTDNELGSGALLLAGAAFLLMATFGLVPVRFKVGDKEMEVGRAALKTLDKVLRESDPATQDAALETFEQELAERGVTREPGDAVEAMLARFERYSGSHNARVVYDSLLDSGWHPSTPGKSTYIRWVYNGKCYVVSLFQNSGTLVASSVQLRDFAKKLPGASEGSKQEAIFAYAADTGPAIDASDAIRRFANEGF